MTPLTSFLSAELQKKAPFFSEWPSFGIHDKMAWLVGATGRAFCWGYLVGTKTALDALYSIFSYAYLFYFFPSSTE